MSNLRLDQAVEIKAELEALNYADLKAKFIELGIDSVWKAGVKKSVLIQSALQALENSPKSIAEEIEEEEIGEEAEEIEVVEEEILTDEERRDSIGDEEVELQDKDPEDDEEFEEEIEEAIVEEIEIIDEDKYTEAEILENIEIVQCNMVQAIPTTRNFLLKKLDALQKALERKQAK